MYNCFEAADILLPDFGKINGHSWSVVACDQFTSEPEYWERVRTETAGQLSTLNLILPEVYLSETTQRVPKINQTMREYLEDGILTEHPSSMVCVARTQSDGSVRRGIVGMIDLEQYDYRKGSVSLVRATEGTVLERIPPRVAVRRDAPLELPHVMILIDDPGMTVIEPIAAACDGFREAYDFDLMLGGGHINGTWIPEAEQQRVLAALEALATPAAMKARYGSTDLPPLLFAVGDGNHSLASAKASYDELRQTIGMEAARKHPARYALAEIVNLHDPALRFEPIYRVLFHVDPSDVIRSLQTYADSLTGDEPVQRVQYLSECLIGEVLFNRPTQQLAVGTLQTFLDGYLTEHPGVTIDYIHGEDAVRTLSGQKDAVGFLFDGMEKFQLFRTVIFDGALPRKTFSMGHAEDKRYYLECRKIK